MTDSSAAGGERPHRRWKRWAAVAVCLAVAAAASLATLEWLRRPSEAEMPFAGAWYGVIPDEPTEIMNAVFGEDGGIRIPPREQSDGQWSVRDGRLCLSYRIGGPSTWGTLLMNLHRRLNPRSFEASSLPSPAADGPIEIRAEGRLQMTLYRNEREANAAAEAAVNE